MARKRPAKVPKKAAPPPAAQPKSKLISLAQLVAATGVSAGHIARAAKLGHVKSAARGQYEFGPALLGLVRYQQAHWDQLPTYDNAAQCSAATGIPVPVIKQARRAIQLGHGGSIALGPLLKAIFESHGENWTEMQNKFAALRERSRFERENGEVLEKSETSHAIKHGLAGLFRRMEQRSNVDLPPALVGLNAAEIQRELVRSDDELKSNLVKDWALLARNGEAEDAR